MGELPKRIRWHRFMGIPLPEGAKNVLRPTRWGIPFFVWRVPYEFWKGKTPWHD